MKKRISKFLFGNGAFEEEFKKQIKMLILVTLGFTIAFTWRQTIFDLAQSFIKFVVDVQSSELSSILTSIFITLVSLLIIFLTSYLLKPKSNDY